MTDKECTIQFDCIRYIKEHIFYVEHLSGWDMIYGEPALSASYAQISASKEPVTTQPSHMQWFPPTVYQKPRTQASFRSGTIKMSCKEVSDYSDKDKDPMAIASSEVEKQFNSVKEFPHLFPKTIPTELLPLREVNHHIDSKPRSEW